VVGVVDRLQPVPAVGRGNARGDKSFAVVVLHIMMISQSATLLQVLRPEAPAVEQLPQQATPP
jgi:hypothetical protein